MKKLKFIATSIVLGLFIFLGVATGDDDSSGNSSNSNNTKGTVYNSSWDGSVRQVEKYLKSTLRDPDSYQSIEWSTVKETADGFMVRHKYRAKNGFGGYVVANQIFYLDSNGNVISVSDL